MEGLGEWWLCSKRVSTAVSNAAPNSILCCTAQHSSLTARSSGMSTNLFIRWRVLCALGQILSEAAFTSDSSRGFISACPEFPLGLSPRQQFPQNSYRQWLGNLCEAFVSDTLNARLSENVTGVYGVLPYVPAVTRAVTLEPMRSMLSPSVTRRSPMKPRQSHLLNSLPSSPHRVFCGFRYGQRGVDGSQFYHHVSTFLR
jgi:hypothetical protein